MQMKKVDIVLIIIALVALFFVIGRDWIFLIKIVVTILLLLVILYWKLFPYKNHIEGNYRKLFDAVGSILNPIVSRLSILPQIRLGTNLYLEIGYLIIVIILILTLIIL